MKKHNEAYTGHRSDQGHSRDRHDGSLGHEHGHSAQGHGGHDHEHKHEHKHDHDHRHDHEHDHKHEHKHDHDHDHDHRNRDHDRGHEQRHGHVGHHHGHGHHGHHHGHGHHHAHAPNNRKGLTLALLVTAGIMAIEFAGGLWSGSLALLADSAHMLSDVIAIGLSLFAMWFSAKPASASKTYGFHRFEIIAALFNGVTLFIIAGFIVKEAYHRLMEPSAIQSGYMMGVAAVGLLANLLSAWFLMREGDVKDNINVRSAYLHVISDALGSVGVLAAGALIMLFKWYWADPVISVIVALLVLRSAWGVIRHTMHILMEGTPAFVNPEEIRRELLSLDGVIDVHDLHVWTITSGLDSLSCHVRIEDDKDSQAVLQQAIHMIEERFHIQHATVQVEKSDLRHGALKV